MRRLRNLPTPFVYRRQGNHGHKELANIAIIVNHEEIQLILRALRGIRFNRKEAGYTRKKFMARQLINIERELRALQKRLDRKK